MSVDTYKYNNVSYEQHLERKNIEDDFSSTIQFTSELIVYVDEVVFSGLFWRFPHSCFIFQFFFLWKMYSLTHGATSHYFMLILIIVQNRHIIVIIVNIRLSFFFVSLQKFIVCCNNSILIHSSNKIWIFSGVKFISIVCNSWKIICAWPLCQKKHHNTPAFCVKQINTTPKFT